MVNLEDWVDQEVLVTYTNGETRVGKITHDGPRYQPYRFRIKDFYTSYTKDGFYWSDKIPSDFNIIKIQPMNKKEQLMVNLEDWVGQEVLITFREGHTDSYKVERYNGNWLYYLVRQLPYTIDGIYTPNADFDIIKIQPMNKKEQLKQQIKALEAELKSLEAADKVPDGFDEEKAYEFLVNGKIDLGAYRWGQNTQEGQKYWVDISIRNTEPTDKDVIQLQKWIIESYRRKLGLDS